MTVDSTSLLVALKQKPHPSDAGSEVVCVREEKREEEGKMGSEKMRKCFESFIAGGLVFFAGAACAGVELGQTVMLEEGWNSVSLQIGIAEDVNDIFRDWPVEWVALYDPAAFLDTKQYSADGSGEGTIRGSYRMWRRAAPELADFRRIPADSVLVCYATNVFAHTYYGEPRAPRITWHKSSSNELLNVVGFRVHPGKETTADRYFAGLDVGPGEFYIFGGDDRTKPFLMPTSIAGTMTFTNGQVIAVASEKVSDWSGALYVSPRGGVNFGDEATVATFEVRNDAPTNRTVEISFSAGDIRPGTTGTETVPGLYQRDRADAVTNGPWTVVQTGDAPLRKELAAGETWTLFLSLDRSQFTNPVGYEYGELIVVDDVTPEAEGGSAMQVAVPLKATCDGGKDSEYAWPKGVWVASAELDTVTFTLTKDGGEKAEGEGEKKAGGTMKVRLPLYVDGAGKMTLLQRFWYGRDTNGVLRCFSGAIEKQDDTVGPLVEVQRVSTPFLPTDQPEIAIPPANYVEEEYVTYVTETNEHGEVVGTNEVSETRQRLVSNNTFGTYALASFTVGENSKVNPMRHALHPQHDGLTADYKDSAPSGDNFNNYVGTVKPESFSIVNRIGFTWDATGGSAWDPKDTLTGSLVWEFDGLRHEGTLRAIGRFVMKRVSPVTMKMK